MKLARMTLSPAKQLTMKVPDRKLTTVPRKHHWMLVRANVPMLNPKRRHRRVRAPRYMIDPESKFKQIWDLSLTACVMYTTCMVPYRVCFHADATGMFKVIELAMDFVFFIDIALSFSTGASLPSGEITYDRKRVAALYIRGWFFLDLLSTIPYDTLSRWFVDSEASSHAASALASAKLFRFLKALRLFKIARIRKLSAVFSNLEDAVYTNQSLLSLIRIMCIMLFLSHVVACVWFVVGDQESETTTWVHHYGFDRAPHNEDLLQYIVAMYWTMVTMGTLGYGDIVAQNRDERIFAIAVMAIGVSFFGYVVGTISGLISNLDVGAALYEGKMTMIREYIISRGIPKQAGKQITDHFEYYYQNRSVFKEKDLLERLPTAMRNEMIHYIHRRVVVEINYFNQCHESLISDMVQRMRPFAVMREDYVFVQHEIAAHVFFLLKGKVNLTKSYAYSKAETRLASLANGEHFGELEVFDREHGNGIRICSAIARCYSELTFLSHEDLDHIGESWPEMIKYFKTSATNVSVKMQRRTMCAGKMVDLSMLFADDRLQQPKLTKTLETAVKKANDKRKRTQASSTSVVDTTSSNTTRTNPSYPHASAPGNGFRIVPVEEDCPRGDHDDDDTEDHKKPASDNHDLEVSNHVDTNGSSDANDSDASFMHRPEIKSSRSGIGRHLFNSMLDMANTDLHALQSMVKTAKRTLSWHSYSSHIDGEEGASQTDSGTSQDEGKNPAFQKMKENFRASPIVQSKHNNLHSEAMMLKGTFVLHPQESIVLGWQFLVAILILYSIIMVPFRLGFDVDPEGFWVYFELFIDLLFFMDIIINFRTAFYNQERILIHDNKSIALKYLKGWFLCDFLSTVPFDQITSLFFSTHTSINFLPTKLLRMIRIARLLKLVRLMRLSRVSRRIREVLQMSPSAERLLRLLLLMSLFAHWNACLFHSIAYVSESKALASWVSELFCPDNVFDSECTSKVPIADQYIVAMYWAFMTLTTVGYGDVKPSMYSVYELMATIVMIVIDLNVFAYILSCVITLIKNLDPTDRENKERMNEMKDYIRDENIDRRLARNVKVHYQHAISSTSLFPEEKIFNKMRPSLRFDIARLVAGDTLFAISLITMMEDTFKGFVSYALFLMKPMCIMRAEKICRSGCPGTEAYFVVEGECELVNCRSGTTNMVGENSIFEQYSLMAPPEDHYRAESTATSLSSKCILYSLGIQDFKTLESMSPAVSTYFQSQLASVLLEDQTCVLSPHQQQVVQNAVRKGDLFRSLAEKHSQQQLHSIGNVAMAKLKERRMSEWSPELLFKHLVQLDAKVMPESALVTSIASKLHGAGEKSGGTKMKYEKDTSLFQPPPTLQIEPMNGSTMTINQINSGRSPTSQTHSQTHASDQQPKPQSVTPSHAHMALHHATLSAIVQHTDHVESDPVSMVLPPLRGKLHPGDPGDQDRSVFMPGVVGIPNEPHEVHDQVPKRSSSILTDAQQASTS